MKKFILACLLALPLTAASRQEASAWCDFKIGGGFAFACHCNGVCCCAPCGPNCGDAYAGAPVPPPVPPYGVADYGYGYGAGCAMGQVPYAPPVYPVQYQPGYVPNAGYTPVGYPQAAMNMYGR